METITEEKIRTLLVPVPATETMEVNISLPYFAKKTDLTARRHFMLTEKNVIEIDIYHTGTMGMYTLLDKKDSEIANWDISDKQEFMTAFDQYIEYIKNLVQ